MPTFCAALFDVGGTLVDDRPEHPIDHVRLERLRGVLPEGDSWTGALLAAELEPLAYDRSTYVQDTRGAIARVLERNGVRATDELVERVRAACCLPLPAGGNAPRAGALEALRDARRRGLRVALVTNVLWRTQADVLSDWEAFGFANVDAVSTSLDVGRFKPHPAMFEHALTTLGVSASEAVMIGNSREADVAPAKRLGMRAVLVRSREPSASDVEPDAVIDELTELPALFDRWR